MDMTMSSIRSTRVEVVTSVQRHRRWNPEQKLEIFKLTNQTKSTLYLVVQQLVLKQTNCSSGANLNGGQFEKADDLFICESGIFYSSYSPKLADFFHHLIKKVRDRSDV